MATVAVARPRTGRAAELVLLILAWIPGIAGYCLSALTLQGQLPTDLGSFCGVLIGTTLAAHLLVRWRAPFADPMLLPLATVLNGIGLAMIYRLDLSAVANNPEAAVAGPRQLLWMLVALAAVLVVLVLLPDHRSLRRWPYLSMVFGLVLLLSPLLPVVGQTINGSRLWVGIGPISFQPAEFAKLFLAVFFAAYLAQRRESLQLAGPRLGPLQLPRAVDLGPILLVWVVSVGVLVLERDLGTSMLFFAMFVAMLYVATERVSWIVIGVGLVAAGVAAATYLLPYVGARFDVWLHAFDPTIYDRRVGGSYQVVQGLFGLGSGGMLGTGWGEGFPGIVPYANSDFIVASLGEELGLTGLLAILAVYLIFTERGIRAALGIRDAFGKLLASGLAFVMAFQVFIVVGGVTRLIPLTGLTTPFLAAGGSSLIGNWLIVALLLIISHQARRPTADASAPVGEETIQIALSELGPRQKGAAT